jgi:hypothetical protein
MAVCLRCTRWSTPKVNLHHAAPDHPVHHANILREAAARRLKAGCNADALVGGALRVIAAAAVKTLLAGDMVKQADTVAGNEPRHVCTSRHHHPCCFMPINSRRRKQIVLNLLEISMAYAAGLDPYQQLAWADHRHGDLFDADPALAAIHARGHVLGNRRGRSAHGRLRS